MKPLTVETVDLRVLAMPLVHPFRTSFGTETVRRTVVVRVGAGGLEGWGECPVASFPGYAYETVETALHVLSDFLLPGLPGSEVRCPDEGLPEAFVRVRGHPMAKTGVEAALYDLFARREGISLAQLHGGSRASIEVGVSVGMQPTVDELLGRVASFVERGYGRVKIKIQPGWDREVLGALRGRFPDLPLWVDANQAYGPGDMDLLASLDDFGPGLVEQPFGQDDLPSHAELARRARTPVCLDESVGSAGCLETALALGAIGALNIKAPRVGGYAAAKALHDRARAAGLPVWCGGLLETGIGRLHNVALASLEGFVWPGDLSESGRYFETDVVSPGVELEPGGRLAVPAEPGLGREVDLEAMEAFTERRASFR